MKVNGKAIFGFVAKYLKGKQTPDGNTEFQFNAGGLNFKSTDYEWLIIAGSKAMFKGAGTVNGAGDFGFMLSAVDAVLTESTSIDLFRIKIWDKNNGDAVVYDNQCGTDDYADLDQTTAISGGSIVIHSLEKKTKSGEITNIAASSDDHVSMKVYPNPFSEKLRFEFISPETVDARIELYDMTGRFVKTIFEQQIEGGTQYEADFSPDAIISAIYFYRVTLGKGVHNGKVIFKKE